MDSQEIEKFLDYSPVIITTTKGEEIKCKIGGARKLVSGDSTATEFENYQTYTITKSVIKDGKEVKEFGEIRRNQIASIRKA